MFEPLSLSACQGKQQGPQNEDGRCNKIPCSRPCACAGKQHGLRRRWMGICLSACQSKQQELGNGRDEGSENRISSQALVETSSKSAESGKDRGEEMGSLRPSVCTGKQQSLQRTWAAAMRRGKVSRPSACASKQQADHRTKIAAVRGEEADRPSAYSSKQQGQHRAGGAVVGKMVKFCPPSKRLHE